MKKKYIVPVLNIVHIATHQMIAVSLGVNSETQTDVQYSKDEGDWDDDLWDD